MKRILIVGATSGIAVACARIWAAEGATLTLVARDTGKLEQAAADLRARGTGQLATFVMDATDLAAHAAMLNAAGAIDIALIAYGTLPDQARCERDATAAAEAVATNATSVIALATAIIARMERQGAGTLAVISSVAGDRGRASNYVYGAAKAAVSAFADGARARLSTSGVHVVTIKPGFVDTAMTRDLALPRALVATPDQAAHRIVRGIARRASVLYVPWWWRWIMLIIRHVPEAVFVRLRL
jgi:decaprenylphospho-beta-D-erythro-pentofuranosid-2-ulose 2-reductase